MTGVLPVGLEKSTRIMPVVVHSVKEYICVMELHGQVVFEKVKEVASLFQGMIYQRPPLKSSVKRALRIRRIHSLEILEARGRHVLIRVSSDPGTYMRKLCHDIGILLGTGAHMRELRRTRTGPFTEEDAVTLHELSEAVYLYKSEGMEKRLREIIKPVETAVCELPKILVKDTAVASLVNGSPLYTAGVLAFTVNIREGSKVALFTTRGELVGIGVSASDAENLIVRVEGASSEIAVFPRIIILEKGLYPETWRVHGKRGRG